MTNRVYRHTRRRRSGVVRSVFSSFLLLALGAGLFWYGKDWLRGTTETAQTLVAEAGEVTDTLVPVSVSAAEPLLLKTNIISAFDGQVTGVANRMPEEGGADFHLIVYLPGIDTGTERYTAWLLKDGLADVKRMAELTPRADGSFVADFTADALNGIADADMYRTLVLMKEKRGEESVKGIKMAEAEF